MVFIKVQCIWRQKANAKSSFNNFRIHMFFFNTVHYWAKALIKASNHRILSKTFCRKESLTLFIL